nr:YheC/YheD family protein [Paenibacillus hamazuiensis]
MSGNKWRKYVYMKSFAALAPHLPNTRLMSKDALWQMVGKYGYAIVKPANGSRGRGVIQVAALRNGGYELHYENRKTRVGDFERVYAYIRRIVGSSSYLVQWRVPRATVNGRPFDLRVVVQRRRNSNSWNVTGKLAKVAGKGYIVSNITRSKGRVLPVHAAIRRSTIIRKQGADARVHRVALLSAHKLGKMYPGHRIFGLDVGLDRSGHVWIIEANLFPSMSHFLKLGDKTMIQRIRAFRNG